MRKDEIREQFVAAGKLLEKLVIHHRRRDTGESDYVTEASTRTSQLIYLLGRFGELEDEHEEHERLGAETRPTSLEAHGEYAKRMASFGPLLSLYCEAFYYFAWRAREMLTRISGLSEFDPIGVRDVRHKLIEHADRAGGVMNRNYVFAIDEGLILKPFGNANPGRKADQERVQDKGLYPNAEEFVSKLLPLLEKALKQAATA